MKCGNCGGWNPDDARFCCHCGAVFAYPEPESQHNEDMGVWAFMLVMLLGILYFAYLFALWIIRVITDVVNATLTWWGQNWQGVGFVLFILTTIYFLYSWYSRGLSQRK